MDKTPNNIVSMREFVATKAKGGPVPIDLKLPELELLNEGTMFVNLVPDELEKFWQGHKDKFAFAAAGESIIFDDSHRIFLREHDWVFGSSKAAVMRTLLRWEKLGSGCEFYDWAKDSPLEYAAFFRARDEHRKVQIANNLWSLVDERNYQTDCIRRTPATYRGWWTLNEKVPFEDFNSEDEEIFDPNIPIAEVERTLLEQLFDYWKKSDVNEVKCYDRAGIEYLIAWWRAEQPVDDERIED